MFYEYGTCHFYSKTPHELPLCSEDVTGPGVYLGITAAASLKRETDTERHKDLIKFALFHLDTVLSFLVLFVPFTQYIYDSSYVLIFHTSCICIKVSSSPLR